MNYIFLLKFFFISLLFLSSTVVSAQQNDTLYYYHAHGYNAWIPCKKDSADYFRPTPLKQKDSLFIVEDYYINGQMQMMGFSKNANGEKLHGEVIWYYETGKKQQTAKYDNGKLADKLTTYFQDGTIKASGIYKNGRTYDGTFVKEDYGMILDFNFNPSVASYKAGKRNGGSIFYSNSSQAAGVIHTDENNIIHTNYYDRSGKKIGSFTKTVDEDDYNGIYVQFETDNFQVNYIQRIQTYVNGILEGEVIRYNKDGSILSKGVNKNGKEWNGKFLNEYHTNRYDTYTNGVLDGETIFYDNNGEVLTKGAFKNGEPWSGKILVGESILSYKDGLDEGKHVFYYSPIDSQRIQYYIHFKKGMRDGAYTYFDQQGKTLAIGTYKNDEPWEGTFHEDSFHKYLPAHNINSFQNGQFHGPKTYYDTDGNFILEEEYKEGELSGWVTTINPFDSTKHKCLFNDYQGYWALNYPEEGTFFKNDRLLTYKKSILKKSVIYDMNKNEVKLTQEFSIRKGLTPEDIKWMRNEATEIVSRTYYENGKAYILKYKEGKPFEGIYYDDKKKISFVDGKKEGKFSIKKQYPDIQISGFYKNDLLNGKLTHIIGATKDTSYCIYKDSLPIEGIVHEPYITTRYKNGKKHGQEVEKTYTSPTDSFLIPINKIIRNYTKGKLEGNISYQLDDKVLATAIYENGKPYEGTFYDFDKDQKEVYSNGEKVQHSFLTHDWVFQKTYEKNILTKIVAIKDDRIHATGYYKSEQLYEGSFLTLDIKKRDWDFSNSQYTITNYQQGKKEGKEQIYLLETDEILQQHNYQKGELIESTQFNIEFKTIRDLKIVYKNGKAYQGDIYHEGQSLSSIQHFENGIQADYQYYFFKVEDSPLFVDSLLYKNGQAYDGYSIEEFGEHYHRHKYSEGKLIDTKLYERLYHHGYTSYRQNEDGTTTDLEISAITNDHPILTIKYNDNGFESETINGSSFLIFKLVFDNEMKNSGQISFFKQDSLKTSIKFSNNKITEGDFSSILDPKISISEDGVVSYEKKFGGIIQLFTSNQNFIQNPDYKKYYDIYRSYFESGIVQYYTSDNTTPIASCEVKNNDLDTGIEIHSDSDNKFSYAILKNEKEIKTVSKISLEELIKQLKNIKQ